MDYRDRIVSDHKVMLGKPIIKGTRITVELILKDLSDGSTIGNILENYPHITAEDVYAALSYAHDVVTNTEDIIVIR